MKSHETGQCPSPDRDIGTASHVTSARTMALGDGMEKSLRRCQCPARAGCSLTDQPPPARYEDSSVEHDGQRGPHHSPAGNPGLSPKSDHTETPSWIGGFRLRQRLSSESTAMHIPPKPRCRRHPTANRYPWRSVQSFDCQQDPPNRRYDIRSSNAPTCASTHSPRPQLAQSLLQRDITVILQQRAHDRSTMI